MLVAWLMQLGRPVGTALDAHAVLVERYGLFGAWRQCAAMRVFLALRRIGMPYCIAGLMVVPLRGSFGDYVSHYRCSRGYQRFRCSIYKVSHIRLPR